MFLRFEIFTINYSYLLSIKEKMFHQLFLHFGYGLVSICIKNHPSLLNGGKGWYYYYCIFDYFGVFWASEQCVFGLMVY